MGTSRALGQSQKLWSCQGTETSKYETRAGEVQQMLEQERPKNCDLPQLPGGGHFHLKGQRQGIRRQPPNCHPHLDEARDLTALTSVVRGFLSPGRPGSQVVTGLASPFLTHLVLHGHCPLLLLQSIVHLISHQSGKEGHTGHLPGRGLCAVECLKEKTERDENENCLIRHLGFPARGKCSGQVPDSTRTQAACGEDLIFLAIFTASVYITGAE